ncbi:MAG: HAMP domain-containing sensor histidine kinase, partial [Lachnospiraceae bacterium]|nr:HAMP domain-containing sensor histidine kinase [Lachnospiraceae bacterium]
LTYGDYFLMRIPMEGIRTSARISSEFIMYISIFVILLSMIFIIWISRKITRPLMELTELSKRMSDLDFDAKYTSGGENEIGQLGMHFNKMSEALEETISQLKTANNELQKDIEKKAQVDEMRKEFLSNVSHELKTPLALIQGYSEGLKECINDDAESRDFYCDVIMDEAGKMNQMVQKLLTLNQLEFGNDQLEMDRFDIVQLIQGKIMSTHILAQQKETQIFYDGSDCQHVWGDEFKVEEVLTNYLSNALNHVEGERKIEIRTSVQGKKVRISVFNTGQPIPEADLEQIWVKFYKVDKARTREYGGSGVGLSIVKAIMDSMHQAYGVKNFDNGVEFWFELENANGEQLNDTERGNTKQADTEIPQSE